MRHTMYNPRMVVLYIYRGEQNPWVKGSFSACFVLKLPPQRGEGEKWEGVEISKTKHTEPLTQEITRLLYKVAYNRTKAKAEPEAE